jgi:oligopeptide transport system substrate-binding protein
MNGRAGVITLLFFVLLAILFSFAGCSKMPSGEDPNEMVLYTVMTSKIAGLDPGDIGDAPSARVAGQFFECLYQYDFLKRPYEIIPQLADGMPQISEEGSTYTIKIKKGIRFADDICFPGGKGKELKADDFIYAWKRIANIKNLSKNWWIFDGKIVGFDEFRAYTKTCKSVLEVDYSREVEGLQAPDDYTLVIKLKKPWPQIIYLLAHMPTAPVAKEAADYYGKDIINHPVGTGPYKLDVWHRGSYIKMSRNPNFREEFYPSQGEAEDSADLLADAGKKLPLADKVVWTLIEEEQPLWLQFLRGKIDASGIPKDNYGQAITASRDLTPEMKKLNIHLKTFREPATYWIGFNMEDSILGKNKPLRLAMSYAFNREKYIELFWNNRDEVAHGFIPPIMKDYNPEISKIGQSYNVQKAMELVKEAEKIYEGKLPTLKLAMGGADTSQRQFGQFLQRNFKDAGLDLEVEYMDWPTFLGKVHTKSVQMFSLGWIADYPDVETFLQLFYTKNISPGANNFNYSNPEFDKLYEQVAVMADSPERTELYRKMELIILEDCPAVFINHPVGYVLYHDWVYNYKPHAFQYGLSKYYRVDTVKRATHRELLKQVK